jgi:hypothetical protein
MRAIMSAYTREAFMFRRLTSTLAAIGVMVVSLALAAPASAASGAFDQTLTYGSVEAIPNPTVVDTTPLRALPLSAREAFVDRVLACGYASQVVDLLTRTGAISTVNASNTSFSVSAGGFNGRTTAAIVFTVVDSGPVAASHADIAILTNSLGYVFSQGSAFLLDGDDTSSFGFPANYVVLHFDHVPTLDESHALFQTVGNIDPNLFSTTTSGYTQYGQNYLSLQSAVPDQEFINGYFAAAQQFGVEYNPIVNGAPSLYSGGADFPGNNWVTKPHGESYLGRIPDQAEAGLASIRSSHLRLIDQAQKQISRGQPGAGEHGLEEALSHLPCRLAA